MTAPIEARRLSGVDLGKTVTLPTGKELVARHIDHGPGIVTIWPEPSGLPTSLAPSDLVTITGQPPATHGEGD